MLKRKNSQTKTENQDLLDLDLNDPTATKEREKKRQKLKDSGDKGRGTSDYEISGSMEIKASKEENFSIKEHITFLNEFSERTELDGFTEEQNQFFQRGKEIIRLRTNPPFYLRDDLNKIDNVNKYQFVRDTTDPQYIRSANHPFWSENANKVSVFKREKKGIFDANQGRFINTFSAITNKKAKDILSKESNSAEGGILYDQHLTYKNQIIDQIVKGVEGSEINITIGAYNDYPNLMVHLEAEKLVPNLLEELSVDELKKFVEDEKNGKKTINNTKDQIIEKLSNGTLSFRTETKKAFTLFMLSYYTGLVNKISEEEGLQIYMAERQSFGYASPSIAETIGSFRVNIGLMPPEYADVHIKALKQFEEKLGEFKEIEADKSHKNPFKHEGRRSNDGKILLHTATRSQHPKNNINAMAFNGESIANVMKATIGGLNGNSWDKNTEIVQYTAKPEVPSIILDDKFYSTIITPYQESLSKFLESQSKDEPYSELNKEFSKAIASLSENKVSGEVVEKFDVIQDYLATYALLLVAKEKTFDDFGYGSESEAEDEVFDDYSYGSESKDENRDVDLVMEAEDEVTEGGKTKREGGGRLTVKKIITHNGMRALMNPIFHEMDKIKTKRNDRGETVNADIPINYANTYYEIEAILGSTKFSKSPKITLSNYLDAPILMRDVNAIVIDGKKPTTKLLEELDASKSPVWIIDTTSATQPEMQKIVDKFRNNEQGEMLYLVSSGFKNEQGGADKNSYGTIRVVSKDKEAIDAALEAVKNIDGPLAEVSHAYRRILKDIGMVPRDLEIIKKPRNDNREETGEVIKMDLP
ncbi:hypothetical protein D1816_09470 [Aquimarina sp. AD10]|uniref:hypothetical protein n=1 Tax=Aquimarina sp. AD10 TaxID=1714849 RepID=UPI000E543888|nr:hypothetical protein [Aquimarina sp. AD10]AXT60569.1 hypothetical protein D1816_09470 [Aquimarina sp. AD10]RKN01661.1 hypothetical protein D7033_03335 [Aquimarina sp. AD10]